MSSFGIQGKVALLVIIATSASTLLVAKVLMHRATEALREHELVDLGDEATLRGWSIVDGVDGLREDLIQLAFHPDFYRSVEEGRSDAELEQLARTLCRRQWPNHLRLELLKFGPEGLKGVVPRVLHEKARVPEDQLWFPEPDAAAGSRLHLSAIQRLHLSRLDIPGEPLERWEPVIWAVARVGSLTQEISDRPLYVRVLMTLHSPESPRHLFTLTDAEGHQLVRPDETEAVERGNDEVFLSLGRNPELLDALAKRREPSPDPSKDKAAPKVDRLLLQDYVPLASPYFFQEGAPKASLSTALGSLSREDLETFLEEMQGRIGRKVRIGGMLSGVREIRLLAHNREEIGKIRAQIEEFMKARFGEAFDGIRWRPLVECDEIHSWAVRLLVGEGQGQSEYLLHYAVLDDELASSIEAEMFVVRNISILVAIGFGLVGFLFAMRFIRPLKQMTRTAQRITESPRDRLAREVAGLARGLDTRRRDEVGDIARASKRLFEEIIASQEELEKRVEDRTRELRRANLELEKANEKLMSLSHEKDAFVAKISHDLRQPLNAIFLQVEALELSDLDEMQRKDVQRIRDHAARELNLVNVILEYQKIIMGAESLHRDTVVIPALLDDLACTHGAGVANKPVTLTAEYDADIGELIADERRLRQILGNLIGNACKFTQEGAVRVAARAQQMGGEAWVEFTVTDTGRGMSPEEQAKAFIPFVSNKKDNAGGSGLGLSICRELVAQMGGKIGFVSELGKGTHFSVFLPRVPTSERYDRKEPEVFEASPNRGSNGGAEERGPRGTTLLVIDDDAKVRELLARLLSEDGHRVLVAADGPEGLRLAEAHHPDAITLDVVMPGGMDGWEVLRHLKASPATSGIPVIMVSVMADQEHALALEVEDYLVKPIDVDHLVRVVERVTQTAPQRNLLLVDDDVESLATMGRLLEAEGWTILTAENGAEALEMLSKTRPAAIVLDLMMPEMDGFEFLQHLGEDAQLRSIPVVVMSGKDPTEAERDFLRRRVDAVLKKGRHSADDLLATVKERLRRRAGA